MLLLILKNARRELRYSATPKALKDYNDDNTAILRADLSKTKLVLMLVQHCHYQSA